jgi:hypothetical protein
MDEPRAGPQHGDPARHHFPSRPKRPFPALSIRPSYGPIRGRGYLSHGGRGQGAPIGLPGELPGGANVAPTHQEAAMA